MRSWSRTFSIVRMHTVANSDSTAPCSPVLERHGGQCEIPAHMPDNEPARTDIPGYNPGAPEVAKSPISMDDWEKLKQSAFFSDEDVTYLSRPCKTSATRMNTQSFE